MKRLALVLLLMGGVGMVRAPEPVKICAVLFNQIEGELTILYDDRCPSHELDSLAVLSLEKFQGKIPRWCEAWGIFPEPVKPKVLARCIRPPDPQS